MQTMLSECLPYDLNAPVFTPVLDVLCNFMWLKSVGTWRKQAYLAPNLGARRMAFFVANIVFVCLDKIHQDSMAIRLHLAEIRGITALS